MIEGEITADYEIIATLTILSPTGQSLEIDAILDTGYNGFLTLPPTLASELRLTFASASRAYLADGSEATFNTYDVTTLWDGQPRQIEADAIGDTPLMGMQLLERHSLYMEVVVGGRVVVQALE